MPVLPSAVEAYQAADGSLFLTFEQARDHDLRRDIEARRQDAYEALVAMDFRSQTAEYILGRAAEVAEALRPFLAAVQQLEAERSPSVAQPPRDLLPSCPECGVPEGQPHKPSCLEDIPF